MSEYEGILQLLSWVLIVGGTFFVVIGAIGTLRFPDFWARLHAGWTLVSVKLIFIGIFLFITGPTSTHAIANAALVSGLRPKSQSVPTGNPDEHQP